MMKRLIFLVFFICAGLLSAQNEPTIAILDVVPKYVDQVKADIIYEFILDRINRTGAYVIVERSELNKALSELEISLSDMVDETTAVRIGKLAGAQFVLISSLILESNVYYLSMRVVSIETGKISKTSVKSTEDFSRINELTIATVEYLLEAGEKVSDKTVPEAEVPTTSSPKKPEKTSPMRLVAGGLCSIPVLDDAEVLKPGFGGVLGLDFKIKSWEIGDLLAGFKLSGIVNNTVDAVSYQYNLINIPVWLSVSYNFTSLAPVSFLLELDGGVAGNGFFYTREYPDRTDQFLFIPALAPGGGVGVDFMKRISAVLFCNYLIVFYDTYPFTGIMASLRLHVAL